MNNLLKFVWYVFFYYYFNEILWIIISIFKGNETVIRRTQNVGERLLSSGHYATSAIKTQMNRLNDEWQNLTRLLDNRTNILTASLQFHQKADEVKFTSISFSYPENLLFSILYKFQHGNIYVH